MFGAAAVCSPADTCLPASPFPAAALSTFPALRRRQTNGTWPCICEIHSALERDGISAGSSICRSRRCIRCCQSFPRGASSNPPSSTRFSVAHSPCCFPLVTPCCPACSLPENPRLAVGGKTVPQSQELALRHRHFALVSSRASSREPDERRGIPLRVQISSNAHFTSSAAYGRVDPICVRAQLQLCRKSGFSGFNQQLLHGRANFLAHIKRRRAAEKCRPDSHV